MNPLLIIGAIGLGLLLLKGKKPDDAQPSATIKLPTARQSGSVSVSVPKVEPLPSVPTLQPPTVVEIPEVTVTGKPADTSLLLTADEMSILDSGTNAQIYDAAVNSSHVSFVVTAGLALSGKGDPRGPEVSAMALELSKGSQS
jgi:hypothetical protein